MEKLFWITTSPLDIQSCMDKVVRREAGAICTFTGIAREFTKGKKTLYLEYDAYIPMAEKQLARIGQEIQEMHPDAEVAIGHRIGKLDISEVAVVIAVSTPHRKAAFHACEYAIERIKEIVPIWKKENWEDGTEWIGDQRETTSYPEGKPMEGDM